MDNIKIPLLHNSICKLSALLIKFPQVFFTKKIIIYKKTNTNT